MASDSPRQRVRVVGGASGGGSSGGGAGSLQAAMAAPPPAFSVASSPSPRLKVLQQAPTAVADIRQLAPDMPRPNPVPMRVEVAPARPSTPPTARVMAQAAAAAAQQPGHSIVQGVPDLPAPRSWTPSKLGTSSGGGSGSTTRSMTPAEALEKEMQELSGIDPSCSAAPAAGTVQPRPHSSGMAYYRNPCFDATVASTAATHGGMGVRPASSGGSPLSAQHNNLMAPGQAGHRPGSSGATIRSSREDFTLAAQQGLAKLKGTLQLVGKSDEQSSTAVQAFDAPVSPGAAAGASTEVVVARRRGTAPARLQPSSCSRTTAQWEQEAMALLSAGDRLAVLQLTGPSSGVVRCYIKRISGMLGMGQHFELRLESTDECLAVARRRVKSATSSFVIGLSSSSCSSGSSTPSNASQHGGSSSNSSSALHRDDPEVVGKLKANVMGTEYLLRGRGGDCSIHKGFNAQLLAVNYKPTINHMQAAPRTMTAVLPLPESQAWSGSQPSMGGQFDSLTACMEAARERQLPPSYERDLVMLHTMRPHFDPVKKVHYLDFKGRVREVSMKNFQLVHWDHNRNQLGTDLVLLFGKKEHSEYALDFCYPMNLLQAFALGLSSIDTKLCYAV